MSQAKLAAGRRAADLVPDRSTLGLGTGSTVRFFLERLAERIRDEGLEVRGVPTSIDTETVARELGIPLVGLDEVDLLDFTVDGADEIDAEYRMIKGGGGALLREKVVASISRREVIVVGRDKVVERLGTTFDLPVEVVPFALPVVARQIARLGGEPRERQAAGGGEYRTDNGNAVLDVHFEGGIEDPEALELTLAATPGVVECGLFLGLADAVVIADDDGTVEVREKG
ncbi:ribose-5-phosphate isomerase RpiA [Engelhardtia mirabilis]|uniref:Ribose-5-phosphate isomerase A n=1 Tax=Engelhardtia mirabilis TaxID=2528011 RepID=A0A518BSZ0_9BACT|nr:Ribose-5-phosphate isomerase A [Planctomycetes bacterium Pla133]QDV04415.1 Ribose-5-phosphate isomerase A [Planctomycetes bacterium Pla86]